jgi:glucose-6-phosphate isomerase
MIKISGGSISKIDRDCIEYKELLQAHKRLAQMDATLWGPQAATEAAVRLNWIDLPNRSRELLPLLDALSAKNRDKNVVILCGMGGSSLAPEVIAATYEKQLFVMDSTDPSYVERALNYDLSKVLVIVSSKSGTTIETTSQRAIFEQAFLSKNLDPKAHMVFITDPGSALDNQARDQGFTVINADPNVGGRFSALSAFGLVPAAVLGIDVSVLLDNAGDAKAAFLSNPQLVCDIAYLISYVGKQYISFNDSESSMPGLSDWIEQLVAESTGKNKVGRLPVVIKSARELNEFEMFSVAFGGSADLVVSADLSAQFMLWEWVTSLICYALKVDPFNQPNVTEAKEATSSLLSQWKEGDPLLTPDHLDGEIEIFGQGNDVKEALKSLIASIPSDGYISIMAYLDRIGDARVEELREILTRKSQRPVTFGWGPRFLHSTGQFHKGGQPNGVFLQITGVSDHDFEIPGQKFTLRTLIAAQALGDADALRLRKYPLIRLNLKNRAQGITNLLAAAESL